MPLATTNVEDPYGFGDAYDSDGEIIAEVDEDEADEEWDGLKDTFVYMMERAHERANKGLKRKGVLPLVISGVACFMVFVGLYGFVSTFRIAKIYPFSSGECLAYGAELLWGPPTDIWGNRRKNINSPEECGVAVAAKAECSRVFVWPKSNTTFNGSACRCCAKSEDQSSVVDPMNLLNSSTEWDAYIFSYEKRGDGGLPSWCPSLLLTTAILMTIACLLGSMYAWVYMDSPFIVFYMSVGILYSFWFLYFHFKPDRMPLNYWHGSMQYFFLTPSVEEVWLTINFGVALFILIVLQCVSGCFFKCFVRCCSLPESSTGGCWFLKPEPSGHSRATFSYRPLALGNLARRTFWYEGEVNDEGKPHGKGQWKDESFHGESLKGIWDNGRPLGKFCSRETGSGALFVQGPIGYVASRADCQPGSLAKGACQFEKAKQRCGNVMVECSIAGGYFSFLPAIRNEEERVDSIGEMIRNVEGHLNAFKSYQMDDEIEQHRSGTYERKEYIVPELNPMASKEAIVFVHGWASDMETALTKLSLMLFLGKVPDNYIPIVFGWSCGNLPAFFYVKNHSEEYEKDFKTLFREIRCAGIEKVHVIAHSMGVQVWCKNCPLIADECFFPCTRLGGKARAPARANDTRVQLANVIFMNGEALVEELAEAASGESSMLNYADRLSLYIDSTDIACLASQVAQSILPWKYQAWRNPELNVKATKVLGRIVSDYKVKIRRQDKKVLALDGEIVQSVMSDEWFQSHLDGYADDEIVNDNTCIDVIDCTNLDTNAGFSRHNYWGLNALMAEDIVSNITKCIPAAHRVHLVRRKNNVYDYLSAPSIVTA